MKKIAIVMSNGLGDFIAGVVPTCKYLEETYGECEFHFFMAPTNIGIAKYFYPNAFTYIVPEHNRLYNNVRFGLKYRHLNFDIGVICYPDSPRFDSILIYALGAKERYGRKGRSLVARMLLNKATDLYRDVDLAEDHVGLCCLRTFNPGIRRIEDKFYPRFRVELLEKYKPANKGPYILVECTNHKPWELMTVEKTSEILNSLGKVFSFTTLIVAMPKDKDKAEILHGLLKMPSEICVFPKLDGFLGSVAAADIVLCGDGGTAHIAASMGKHLVALFARTPISHWGPLGVNVQLIKEDDNVNFIPNEIIIDKIKSVYCNL